MPKIFLSGVIAIVSVRNTSVSIPVVLVANSSGFGPTRLWYRSHKSNRSGTSELTKTTSFVKRTSIIRSEVPDQIHSLVQMCDLLRVTVEQECVTPVVLTNSSFGCL